VGPDQLLPHVMHWHDEHAKCNTLVNDHQYNGHRSYWGSWQQVIHISCRSANNICMGTMHDTNDHMCVLSHPHECMLCVCVMQEPVWLIASCSLTAAHPGCGAHSQHLRTHMTIYAGYTTVCDCISYLWMQNG